MMSLKYCPSGRSFHSLSLSPRFPFPRRRQMKANQHRKAKQQRPSAGGASANDIFHLTKEQRTSLGLSNDVLDACKEVFMDLDTDGNGSLDSAELRAAMTAIGMNPSDDELTFIMNDIDSNGNGAVDFYELAQMVAKLMKAEGNDPEKDLRDAFKVFDVNGDGFISKEEVLQVTQSLGQSLSQQDVEKMFAEADENNDGQLDYSEFVKAWFGDSGNS